ncbi:MAG: hypothetical protein NXI04_02960 [Planctomycetaceae bacterium]|nr:hypothetical protein [Planctomycetaceae bacterium]
MTASARPKSSAVRVLTAVAADCYRWGYLLAMYTGLRAIFNRLTDTLRRRSIGDPALSAGRLDGLCVPFPADAFASDLVIRVHTRSIALPGVRAGMISVAACLTSVTGATRLSWRHRLLRWTSHFGCGDVEIAFYESDQAVTLYGFRNIIAGNSRRLRMRLPATAVPDDPHTSALVIAAIVQRLTDGGQRVRLASPAECVSLAVNDRLLPAHRRGRAQTSLRRRYRELWRRTAALNPDAAAAVNVCQTAVSDVTRLK